jgi:hypothetical protein
VIPTLVEIANEFPAGKLRGGGWVPVALLGCGHAATFWHRRSRVHRPAAQPPRRSNGSPGEFRDHCSTNQIGWIEGACTITIVPGGVSGEPVYRAAPGGSCRSRQGSYRNPDSRELNAKLAESHLSGGRTLGFKVAYLPGTIGAPAFPGSIKVCLFNTDTLVRVQASNAIS